MRDKGWRLGAAVLALSAGLLVGCGTEENTSAANAPETPSAGPQTGTSGAHTTGGHSMNSPSMQRLHAATGAEFERAWLTAMIEHHQGAVDMSRMAMEHLKRKEVREAAEKIIGDQEREIGQMRTWQSKWSGSGSEPGMAQTAKAEMDPMLTAFKRDCKTDCDRAFLTHMIPHHQGALAMAQMAHEKAVHPELKQFAGQMQKMQRQEIEQFQRWLSGE